MAGSGHWPLQNPLLAELIWVSIECFLCDSLKCTQCKPLNTIDLLSRYWAKHFFYVHLLLSDDTFLNLKNKVKMAGDLSALWSVLMRSRNTWPGWQAHGCWWEMCQWGCNGAGKVETIREPPNCCHLSGANKCHIFLREQLPAFGW